MIVFEKHFEKKIYWHFFAPMHVKGVVDGIGATVKRTVALRVKSSQFEVKSAADYASALKDLQISVMHVRKR